jgi:alkanesulfonate monooxygenase SsuD/methylene tetrahydromethanopterin reductase-like flavin-dependent oxidoreductase (luciferase family)
VWFADHFMPDESAPVPPTTPVLEAGSVVAALAAVVPRVRIGTLVYGNTYRHPAVVANMAATVDEISGGRFVLGLGAGWQENEHRQYGLELPGTRELIDRFEEALQVVRGLLRHERTTIHGRYYRLDEAVCEPKGVQRPVPVMVGATGERRMLPLVARYADEWNAWGLPATIGHKMAVLDRHCEALGRDPREIHRTAQAQVILDNDPRHARRRIDQAPMPAFGGTLDQIAAVVEEYARLGLDELIVPTSPLGGLDEVLAAMDALMAGAFAA